MWKISTGPNWGPERGAKKAPAFQGDLIGAPRKM